MKIFLLLPIILLFSCESMQNSSNVNTTAKNENIRTPKEVAQENNWILGYWIVERFHGESFEFNQGGTGIWTSNNLQRRYYFYINNNILTIFLYEGRTSNNIYTIYRYPNSRTIRIVNNDIGVYYDLLK